MEKRALDAGGGDRWSPLGSPKRSRHEKEIGREASFSSAEEEGYGSSSSSEGGGGGGVPEDFGLRNGTEVSNKTTVLREVDAVLGRDKPPAVEFIFVEPYSDFAFPIIGGYGLSRNPYGHAAVRYTLPWGEEVVMNIVGLPGQTMVNFLRPEEYFFGTKSWEEGAEQGGIYNRNMATVRIEEWPAEQILDMHNYFQKLQRKGFQKTAKFSLLLSPLYNGLASWLPWRLAERGNCARFTSAGLVEGGLLYRPTMWPKSIWVQLFETQARCQAPSCSSSPSSSSSSSSSPNVNVVYFRRVRHVQRTYGSEARAIGAVAPLHSLGNILYFDLERYANAVVDVPEGSTTAQVHRRESPAQPSFLRYHRFGISTTTAAAVAALSVYAWRRGRSGGVGGSGGRGGAAALAALQARLSGRKRLRWTTRPS
ncbi:Transmembrane protein [Balamuthia mandrillaris]